MPTSCCPPPAPAVLSEAETDGPATKLGTKPRRGGHAAGLFVERLLCHPGKDPVIVERSFFGVA